MRGDPRVYRALAEQCLAAVDPNYTVIWPDVPDDYLSSEYTWPGDGVLHVSDTDEMLAIHDVAHVIVCPPERRCLPEFGLGPDPGNPSWAERVISYFEANGEESNASVLHVALACYVGGFVDGENVAEYLALHSLGDVGVGIEFYLPYLHYLPADFWEVVAPTLRVLDETLRTQ